MEPSDESNLPVFAIKGLDDPQLIPRVAGVFAQRSIIPVHFSCQRTGDTLSIDVQLQYHDAAIVELLAERLRAIVCVERVHIIEGQKRI